MLIGTCPSPLFSVRWTGAEDRLQMDGIMDFFCFQNFKAKHTFVLIKRIKNIYETFIKF